MTTQIFTQVPQDTTTDPVTTGLAGNIGDRVRYKDCIYRKVTLADKGWAPELVPVTSESQRGVGRLLAKLDPDGTYAWRTRTVRFPVTSDLNAYTFVSSNVASAGSLALATVPVTYDPAFVYLSTTETSGGLLMTSTTAGATTALALSAGTADSGVHMTLKWGTTAAGSTTTIAAGATALAVAGCVNNTLTAKYGFGVDGATSTTKFCIISDSTTGGSVATTAGLDQSWHDVELVRKGGVLTAYVDGSSVGTYGAGGAYLSTAAAPIGAFVSTAGSYNANISVGEITVLTAAKTGS